MKTRIAYLLPAVALGLSPLAVKAESESNKAPEVKKEIRVVVKHDDKRPTQPVTFLGVETNPVSPALAAQLALPEGVGLAVGTVLPESPAATAGLKVHDVLVKFNDQQLIEQRQLGVLVRNKKEGDEVSLTLMRGGKEQVIKVKLGKKDMPAGGVFFGKIPTWTPEHAERLRERMEDIPEMAREEADRVLGMIDEWRRDHNFGPGQDFRPGQSKSQMRIIRRHDGTAPKMVDINVGKSNIAYSDDDGSLTLKVDDGKKTLVAKDKDGKVLFDGPINTPEERAKLPKNVSDRLESIEDMNVMTFKTDEDFKVEAPQPPPPPPGGKVSYRIAPPVRMATIPTGQVF